MSLLQVQQIQKQLTGGLLINDISFEQKWDEKVVIAGASGAGKTTLLKMIAGLSQPDGGIILFNEKKVIGSNDKLMPGHPQIAYLSQYYELLNNYRVGELVWFENRMTETAASTLFETCEINNLLHRRTDQLSGGEKQRIALCLLLAKSPKLLILDEPFSNLDLIHTTTLKKVLENIAETLQITCLLTSHDPQDVLPWADKIIILQDGQIIQQGNPQTIYHQPLNEYVAALFGSYNLISQGFLRLFPNIGFMQENHSNIIIRPEHFSIVSTADNAVKGVVRKISFCGNHYEVKIEIETVNILVHANKVDFSTGDEVFVTCKLKNTN